MRQHVAARISEDSLRRCRRGGINLLVVFVILMLLIGMGGLAYWLMSTSKTLVEQPLTAVVERGTFIAEVLDQGEIQSSENVEFRCEVKSRYSSRGVSILEVVEEGKMVKGGDFLISLDSAELDGLLENQEITVSYSRDSVAAAENKLKAAIEAKREYIEGTFVSAEREIQNDILLAKEEKRKAEDYYRYSQRLAAKRYITEDQLQADKFAVARADNALQLAEVRLDVLARVTRQKKLIEFDSDIDTARSKLNTVKEDLAISQRQLDEIKSQIAKCTIRVPEGVTGQVVYANIFSSRGNSEWVLEPGASVRERQVMIRLPNREKMQVRAKVNESRITSIREGMTVEARVDALGDQTLRGVVKKVNQYAEPEGWGSGGVKKYAVFIDIIDPPMSIRPGMNASVSVRIKKLEDAVMAPLQCVYGVGERTFCMVQKSDRWETREIRVEMNNDKQVLITDGVEPGERLAMNPGGFRHLMDLPQDVIDGDKNPTSDREQQDAKQPIRPGKRSVGPPSSPSDQGQQEESKRKDKQSKPGKKVREAPGVR